MHIMIMPSMPSMGLNGGVRTGISEANGRLLLGSDCTQLMPESSAIQPAENGTIALLLRKTQILAYIGIYVGLEFSLRRAFALF